MNPKSKRKKSSACDIPYETKVAIVQREMDYLEAEGFVVKIGDSYRLRTQEELAAEVNALS